MAKKPQSPPPERGRVNVSISRATYTALQKLAAAQPYPTPLSKIADHAISEHVKKEMK